MKTVLPWPLAKLSPNARVHWAQRAKLVKQYREACRITAMSDGARDWPYEGKIHVWANFFPPDKRRRDWDNIIASSKALFDGLADALKVDDSRFVLHPMVMTEIGGMVKITLTADSDALSSGEPS